MEKACLYGNIKYTATIASLYVFIESGLILGCRLVYSVFQRLKKDVVVVGLGVVRANEVHWFGLFGVRTAGPNWRWR
jgi:hypothetical protein